MGVRLILRELHQSTFLTVRAFWEGKGGDGGVLSAFFGGNNSLCPRSSTILIRGGGGGGRFSIVTMTKQARKVKETRWKRSPEKEQEFGVFFPEEKKSSSGKVESVALVSRPPQHGPRQSQRGHAVHHGAGEHKEQTDPRLQSHGRVQRRT